jgi:hypothetical protein
MGVSNDFMLSVKEEEEGRRLPLPLLVMMPLVVTAPLLLSLLRAPSPAAAAAAAASLATVGTAGSCFAIGASTKERKGAEDGGAN